MFHKSCRPFDDSALAREPLRAAEDFARGDFEQALERSERFVRLGPNEAWAWRFRGECLFALGRYQEASRCFRRALELGGIGTEDTFLWQAIALERTGDVAGARHTLEEAMAHGESVPGELWSKAESQLRALPPVA